MAHLILRFGRILDGLREVLHGLLDSVSSLGAHAVQERNASLVLLTSNSKEARQSLGTTRVGRIVLVRQNTKQNAFSKPTEEKKTATRSV